VSDTGFWSAIVVSLAVQIPSAAEEERECSDHQSQQSGNREAAQQDRPVAGVKPEQPTVGGDTQCHQAGHGTTLLVVLLICLERNSSLACPCGLAVAPRQRSAIIRT